MNNYSVKWQNIVSKNFYFFLVAAISRIQKPKTKDNHLFQLKKKRFQRISFFFSFIFWGGCYIQTSKGTFMWLCINRHKLVVSIYLYRVLFKNIVVSWSHQTSIGKKPKYNNTSALNTLYACCSCYYKDIYSFILLII